MREDGDGAADQDADHTDQDHGLLTELLGQDGHCQGDREAANHAELHDVLNGGCGSIGERSCDIRHHDGRDGVDLAHESNNEDCQNEPTLAFFVHKILPFSLHLSGGAPTT